MVYFCLSVFFIQSIFGGRNNSYNNLYPIKDIDSLKSNLKSPIILTEGTGSLKTARLIYERFEDYCSDF